MKSAVSFVLTAIWLCAKTISATAEEPQFTPQNVIIETFEARDAMLADVLDALAILAENATGGKWRPSIVLDGEKLGERRLTLKVSRQSLASALDEAARLARVTVVHSGRSSIISAKKG